MRLVISQKLSFPADIVTQTIGILAKRRAGKSYTARRFVEQLCHGGHQVVIVDPKGDWYGIRSSANGKAPGLPITILGGERGDVPLEKAGGELVAKLVVEERVSALLDLSHFRKGEVAVFIADFLETLYRLKAREKYRTPVMLVIDEADAIAPQKPQHGEERMLGAAEDIVRRGGQRGIGCTMITQRSAVLNKNILTQIQVLIALRTIAPQDLKALDAWIDVHGTEGQRKALMSSLPSLPVGDAWVWSPGWPTHDGIFERVHVLPIETFDSGATPKPGEKRAEPKALADVDLDAIRRQMADVVQRAADSDPKALRARIRELEAKAKQPAEIDETTLERVRDEAMRQAEAMAGEVISRMVDAGREIAKAARAAVDQLHAVVEAVAVFDGTPVTASQVAIPRSAPASAARHVRPAPAPRPARSQSSASCVEISGPMQKILDAIAWLESAGIQGPHSKTRVAFLAGYSVNGGAFNNPMGRLRTDGLIDYPAPGFVELTDLGATCADMPSKPLCASDLHDRVRQIVDSPMWRILEPLINAYPNPIPKSDLASLAGYAQGGGAFNNPIGRLRSLGLIDYPSSGEAVALPVLFP